MKGRNLQCRQTVQTVSPGQYKARLPMNVWPDMQKPGVEWKLDHCLIGKIPAYD